MRYLKVRDIKARQKFFIQENLKKVHKFVYINLMQKLKIKPGTAEKFLTIFLNSYSDRYFKSNSKTRLLRRCVFSNRSRAVLRPYGFSRIVLRNFIHFGILPGYKKAVW
jgi:ribosomal protein S14